MPRLYVLDLLALDAATIGRAVEAGVQLRDASVSRHHAKLEVREGTWRVVDTGSRNGITIKGARVTDAALEDGDEFQVGEVLLRFRAAVPSPAATETKEAEELPDEITLEEDPVAGIPEPAPRAPSPAARPASVVGKPPPESATPLERTVASCCSAHPARSAGEEGAAVPQDPGARGLLRVRPRAAAGLDQDRRGAPRSDRRRCDLPLRV